MASNLIAMAIHMGFGYHHLFASIRAFDHGSVPGGSRRSRTITSSSCFTHKTLEPPLAVGSVESIGWASHRWMRDLMVKGSDQEGG